MSGADVYVGMVVTLTLGGYKRIGIVVGTERIGDRIALHVQYADGTPWPISPWADLVWRVGGES